MQDISPKLLVKMEALPEMIHRYGYRLSAEDEIVLTSMLPTNHGRNLNYIPPGMEHVYDKLGNIFEEAVHRAIMDFGKLRGYKV